MTPSIAALVVSWNRCDRVVTWIESILRQTVPVNGILVIDNGSTDDTVAEVKRRFPQVSIVETGANLGHAGAAEVGLREAVSRGHHWIWMFDDDACPVEHALDVALRTLDAAAGAGERIGILYVPGARDVGWNWRGRKIDVAIPKDAPPDRVRLDQVDFNMTLVSKDVVEACGLPRGDYFMMVWETEYCLRVKRAGFEVASVAQVLVRHDHAGYREQAIWRGYYQTRNHLAMVISQRSPRGLFWFAARLLRVLPAEVFRHNGWQRVRLRLAGVLDAVRGRMGRTVDPAGFAATSRVNSPGPVPVETQ